jgi:hypothetical protein
VQLPEGRSGIHENDTQRGAEVALCQTPTDLAAIEAVALPAYRVQRRGERRDTGLGHTKLNFFRKYPFAPNQDRILKKYQLVKPFKIWIPTRQDWQKPDKIDPNVDLWFTDGSGIHNCFGAGIYGPLYNYGESIPMSSLYTMFFCQSDGCPEVYRTPLTKNLTRRRIHICSDSRAALATLIKTTTRRQTDWSRKGLLKSHLTVYCWKKKNHEEAFGSEASGQMGYLYWLPTVQNSDEIPSV